MNEPLIKGRSCWWALRRICSYLGTSVALTAILTLSLPGTGLAGDYDPQFPRLAGILIGGPYDNYADPSYQASMAKLNLVILNYYPGLAPGGESYDSIVRSIKAMNPNTLVFMYTDSDEEYTDPTGSADAELRQKIDDMEWWLYPDTTYSNPVPSFYGDGGDTINNTPYTPKDSNGDDSIDWITKWFVTNYYVPNPDVDGLYMDNVFIQPRVDGDWYRDNEDLSDTDPRAGAALQAGYERWFALVRQLMPGKYQIGNLATWFDDSGQSMPSGYVNMVDGGVMEAMIGKSYSIETWAGWPQMMNQYTSIMGSINAPKLAIFNQWGDPTDYQSFRYGFASCLMNDGYYSFTDQANGYSGVTWFDEFNVNLGQAESPPPTAPWQNGVYRRDFQNGIALVNPKTNGTQTVTLETDYVKINGTQDPSVNDGSVVRTVTLQDRDGIILLRKTPMSQQGGYTFGRTDVGSTPSSGLTANYKRGSKFTLGAQATLASLSAYLDGNGGSSGTQDLRMVLYKDANGVPGAKVAESNLVTITAGQAPAWVTFSVSPVTLAPGDYWIVIHSGDTAAVARDYGGDGAANFYANDDLFSDGASDPFGSGSSGTGTLSVYATYYPVNAKQFGRTDVAGTPSSGLSSDFKRGSKFSLSEQGELLGLSAYMDGSGGAAGSQDVRMDLYQDANGVPGAKVAESSTIAITDEQAAGWVSFPTSQVSLAPGAYWIVIHSGDAAGVGRDYGDGAANWYGNTDTFSDGASDPFGGGSAGTVTLSVYATYVPSQTFGRTDIAGTPSQGLTADEKRGSKFSLTSQGTLVSLSAYLDGNGGATGSQDLRMDLYQDDNGVPGAKVAESSIVSIAAGRAPGWVSFSTPNVSLAAGTYWIVIHSGATAGVARDYGDGADNWYGNSDTFSDGASDPFGTGSAGTGTLSVYATYTTTQ